MSQLINLGIIAHVDAGKTTLTEQLLYLGGNIREIGSVDKGTSQTDFMDIERSRGISVRTATTVINWKGFDMPPEKILATFDELQTVDREQWKHEVMGHEDLFIKLHDHLPAEMIYERELLICRL